MGPLVEQALHRYNISKAFIACQGVTAENGATDFNELEVRVKTEMIKAARESFLLVDHGKFGVSAFATIAAVKDFHRVITDPQVPGEERAEIEAAGVTVLIA